jgi:hypothetical protein
MTDRLCMSPPDITDERSAEGVAFHTRATPSGRCAGRPVAGRVAEVQSVCVGRGCDGRVTGFKTATAEDLPDATCVMDPFWDCGSNGVSGPTRRRVSAGKVP